MKRDRPCFLDSCPTTRNLAQGGRHLGKLVSKEWLIKIQLERFIAETFTLLYPNFIHYLANLMSDGVS